MSNKPKPQKPKVVVKPEFTVSFEDVDGIEQSHAISWETANELMNQLANML